MLSFLVQILLCALDSTLRRPLFFSITVLSLLLSSSYVFARAKRAMSPMNPSPISPCHGLGLGSAWASAEVCRGEEVIPF